MVLLKLIMVEIIWDEILFVQFHQKNAQHYCFLTVFSSIVRMICFTKCQPNSDILRMTSQYCISRMSIFDLIQLQIFWPSAYLEDGVLQTDSVKLRQHYMNSTTFYIDLLCLLPLGDDHLLHWVNLFYSRLPLPEPRVPVDAPGLSPCQDLSILGISWQVCVYFAFASYFHTMITGGHVCILLIYRSYL